MDERAAEQLEADNWMCERINRILNGLYEKTAQETAEAVGKISAVMAAANRRKDKEGNYDRMHFTVRDRNNFDYRFVF